MIFKNHKVYDTLKTISLIAIPVSTFIVAILGAYSYGEVERVTAVLAAVNTLLGSLVKISSSEYNKNQSNIKDI
ncbi:MAG: phage holin [Anaerococcus prevotii]|uniref:phage holin n=1 Tax=Anaerococcus prevotii TaxID=33034 RepID=UPI0028FFCEBC|nr:phage holin [Anaerococcus prevotii]MDU2557407.1 phage holin [Anaerococcus prevotii]